MSSSSGSNPPAPSSTYDPTNPQQPQLQEQQPQLYAPHPTGRQFDRMALGRVPSTSSMSDLQRPRKLRLLVAANGPKDVAYAQALAVRLSKVSQITTRAIVDDMTHRLAQEVIVIQNRGVRKCGGPGGGPEGPSTRDVDAYQKQAFELVEWADLLVLAPIDADNLARMMCGMADTLLLEVLRGWDASKMVLLVPGMSTHMWENPVTKRQMSKLHRKWSWIRVMPPILWQYDKSTSPRRVVTWDAFNEVVGIIKNQANLLMLGHDVEVAVQQNTTSSSSSSSSGPDASGPHPQKAHTVLPPEIWSIIFEYANDWELAMHLGVYTNLPMPTIQGWRLQPKDVGDPLQVYMHELEWTILTSDTPAVCKKLSEAPSSFHDLSALAVHLIFKFSLKDVLTYIEANCPHLFKCFDGKTIPTKASAYYGRTEILDWWAHSPSFLDKQYDAEALDGASAKGFVQVLEWWRRSGLPIKFTETALEQASAKGHLHVLQWWREMSLHDHSIVLKPGRALVWAAQYGQTSVIRWWEDSGITAGYQELVCKTASKYGQVRVLELWRELRGDDKIQFDAQVLSEPTLHAHIEVLEWWRKYAHGELPGMNGVRGKRVEYRTMDIEEHLDDSLGDQIAVRKWWANNGLNLGLGTSEWMKPRCL